MKAQPIRLVDVLLLGPFMVWAAAQRNLPLWARDGLALAGLFTILYNGVNYLEMRSQSNESIRLD